MIPSKHLKIVGEMPWERFVTTYGTDYTPFTECQLHLEQTKPKTEAKAAFITSPQNVGRMPWETFVTTYSSDYVPFKELQPQVDQTKPRTEAKAAPAIINPPQTDHATWPVIHQYFYKTTNSIYGSNPQPLSCSTHPAFSPPLGTFAQSSSEPSGVFGSASTEARTQEVGVAKETRPFLGSEEESQLHYVFGGKVNVWEQQEPLRKFDVLYEQGVIVLSSYVSPACCEDFLRSVCREAGLQQQLHLPVTSSPVITIKDGENCSFLRSLRPACEVKSNTFLQPGAVQCHCCTWQTGWCPGSCCFKMQTFPCGTTRCLDHKQPPVSNTEPSRNPWVTEYQASTAAAWAQPK